MWLHSQSTILDLQLWLLLSVTRQCRSVLWPCEKYILHMLFELDHMILSENFSMNLFFVSTKCKIRFECPLSKLSVRHETCHASQTVLLTRSLSDFVAPSFLNPFGCSHFHGPQIWFFYFRRHPVYWRRWEGEQGETRSSLKPGPLVCEIHWSEVEIASICTWKKLKGTSAGDD